MYANYKQKHTVKLCKLTYIRITKTKHLSSTKSIQLDPWISEPRLTEKLLHLEVNLMEEKIKEVRGDSDLFWGELSVGGE